MFERFTQQAIQVIMLAQEEARRLDHSFLGTEELLLGLMGERSGQAASVLAQFGLNLRQMRREVESLVGRGAGFQAIEIPFTERARLSLQGALNAAQECHSETIDTEHLLLGLLDVEDAVASVVLQNLGVDLSELRSRLLRAIHDDNPTATDINASGATTLSARSIELTAVFSSLSRQLESLLIQLSRALSEAEAISRRVDNRLEQTTSPGRVDITIQSALNRNIAGRIETLPDAPNPNQPGLRGCLKNREVGKKAH